MYAGSTHLSRKNLGCFNTRSASSSNILAVWSKKLFGQPAISIVEGFVALDDKVVRAARINYFLLHRPTIADKDHTVVLMSVSWYKFHHKMSSLGKPLTVWSSDIFEPEDVHSIIPVQLFDCRVVSLLTKTSDETVLIVSPCIE